MGIVFEIIAPILTLVAGGGWFITYRAYKRGANGEATQKEAEGWKSIQDLYQQTIEDFKTYSNDMRQERSVLKQENKEMRDKYNQIVEEILILKKQLSRQGRKIEALTPFLCSIIGCKKRRRDNLDAFASDNSQEGDDEDTSEQEN